MSETATKASSGPISDAAPVEAAPPPTFDVLPLSTELRETLAEIGYTHPTPVQIAVWEPATRGRDAVVQARTGTGKTASFGLPIVDHIVKRSTFNVQVLVLCPTRELALQVGGELARLGKKKDIKVLPIYGGAPMERQIQGIEAGAQVVVGTPGRVLDHIRRGTLKTNSVKLLVLDESDEMLSMGFERELTAILESLPPSRQTLLFSATVPPDIDRMARNKLKNPEFVTLSGDHIGALSIDHFVYMVPSDKPGALARIIEVENPEGAVIFCNTKEQTEAVAQLLQQRGYDADWLNGDLPQGEREKVMSATREGRLRFLVATDVAARGIDISHLTHVINYDFPQDAESYVHRTGRTGRAGRTGTAIALITPQDIGGLYLLRLTYKIKPVERQIPTAGELKTRAEADLISMLGEGYQTKGVHPEDLALARRLLTSDQAEVIVGGLLRDALGARPNAQDEASSARRAQVRRGSLRGRRDQGRPDRGNDTAQRSPGGAPQNAGAQGAGPQGAAPYGAAPYGGAAQSGPRGGRTGAPPARGSQRGQTSEVSGNPSPVHPAVITPTAAAGAASTATPASVATPQPAALAPAAVVSPSLAAAGLTHADPRAADRPPQAPRRDDGRPHDGPRPERRRRGGPEGESREVRGDRGERGDRGRRNVPVTEFANWEPPAEEGDDEPLLEPRSRGAGRSGPSSSAEDRGPASPASQPIDLSDADFTELFVTVGRRDGVRANDLLRALVETAGLDKHTVRRIRVRDRHAFIGVRKADAEQAIAKLNGTTLAGKAVTVEVARHRSDGEERGAES